MVPHLRYGRWIWVDSRADVLTHTVSVVALHPLGYVTADSWGMFNLWSCIFVAWAIKTIILRYGGLGSYRRAVPFFLGVALGDYIVGFIWSILSILTNTPLYSFFP